MFVSRGMEGGGGVFRKYYYMTHDTHDHTDPRS